MQVLIVTPQSPPGETGGRFTGGIERLVHNFAGGLLGLGAQASVLTTRYLSTVATAGRLVPGTSRLPAKRFPMYAMPPGADLVEEVGRLLRPGEGWVVLVVDNGGPFSRPTPQEMLQAAEAVRSRWPLLLLVPFPAEEIRFYSREPASAEAFLGVLRGLAASADRVAFLSRSSLESYAGLGRSDACVIRPGVHAVQRRGSPEPQVLACVSRFGAWAVHKNHISLLEALHLLAQDGKRIHCHFLGPETGAILPLARELGLEEQVTVHGLAPERARQAILEKASLHVLPSAIEAFGFASAEALARGLPVLACAGTAVEELGSAGVHLCRLRRPSRFAGAWRINGDMDVEPDPGELAESIAQALRSGPPRSGVDLPSSCGESASELREILQSMRRPNGPRAPVPRAQEEPEEDFYDPELYEARIGPGSRVADLYVAEAREGSGPILEIGCGTGDVLLPLARSGYRVTGLDASAAMLRCLREHLLEEPEEVRRRVTLLEARMESFSLPEPVTRVFITNDTLLHLLDLESLRAALACSFRALLPEGALVLDVPLFDPRELGLVAAGPKDGLPRFHGRYPFRGETLIQVWERTTYDVESGALRAEFRYEILDPRGEILEIRRRVLRQCPRRPDEIVLALEAAGFTGVTYEVFGGGAEERRVLVRARRPGEPPLVEDRPPVPSWNGG